MLGGEVPEDSLEAGAKSASVVPRWWPIWLLGLVAALGMFLPTLLGMSDYIRFFALMLSALFQAIGLLIWVLVGSRLKWRTRWAMLGCGLGVFVFVALAQDKSLGISIFLYGLPITLIVLALVTLVINGANWPTHRRLVLAAWVLPFLSWLPLRSEGYMASFVPQLRWRWSPTNETLAVAAFKERQERTDHSQPTRVEKISLAKNDWPRFRGADVNGKTSIAGVELSKKMRVNELWRHKAGPSWGSIIHVGGYLFTMEQRGEKETVVCLKAETGQEVWSYGYDARFIDMTQVSGVGPRSTPTFHNGVLYSVGGLGQVSAIDTSDGSLIWKRDLLADTKGEVPQWGYSSSAFVDDRFCFVTGNGEDSESVDTICYDSKTGSIQWAGVGSGLSYSSPQVVELFGKRQVLSMIAQTKREKKGDDIVSRDYETGELLWRYRGQATGNAMVTPLFIPPDRILMGDGSDGAAMLQISRDSSRGVEEWTVRRLWSQNRLLPEFSDFVVQTDRVLGISKGLLTALNVDDGKLLWKKFRFGGGQIIELEDANLILAIAESGKLSLIKTDSKSAEVLLEWDGVSGKTWNHPILIDNRIYVRNSEEMACHEIVNQ